MIDDALAASRSAEPASLPTLRRVSLFLSLPKGRDPVRARPGLYPTQATDGARVSKHSLPSVNPR
jgi:hypothetical protein